MPKHLPFSEFDMAGVTNAVARYEQSGLSPELDAEDKDNGIVVIRFANPMGVSLWVYFEIHKLARPGWFGDKAHWVVQLSSQAGLDIDQRGCVTASTQAYAIHAAEVDFKHGFLSIATFEMAAEAY